MCVPAVIAGLAVWAHNSKKKSAFKISPHGWLSKGTAYGLVRGLVLGAASGWFPCCSVEPVSGVWGVGLLMLWPLGMAAERFAVAVLGGWAAAHFPDSLGLALPGGIVIA